MDRSENICFFTLYDNKIELVSSLIYELIKFLQ